MVVNLVVETRLPLLIGAGHRPDIKRGAIWINDPLPGNEDPGLAVLNGVAVLANKAGALGNQQVIPSRSVIHILANLRDNRAGELGIHCRQQ